MKQIVNKTEIQSDQNLLTIKAFRLLNKRCGEIKAKIETVDADERSELTSQFESNVKKMHALSARAETNNFHLWVNFDGATGHTYEKDYKITRDEANDWDAFQAAMTEQNAAVETLINSLNPTPDTMN
jgi:hypothetical protein